MKNIKITSLEIISRTGTGNKEPCSGDVEFSDGKRYGFSVRDNKVILYGFRKRLASREMFVITSPLRSAITKKALLAGEGKDKIIHIEL